jgi:hypothetical protein
MKESKIGTSLDTLIISRHWAGLICLSLLLRSSFVDANRILLGYSIKHYFAFMDENRFTKYSKSDVEPRFKRQYAKVQG